MADIQGVITLGLGPTTGSDIEHFILLGLNANPAAVVTEFPGSVMRPGSPFRHPLPRALRRETATPIRRTWRAL